MGVTLRDGDGWVPEDLLHNPDIHSLLQEQGRGGVASIVQAGVRYVCSPISEALAREVYEETGYQVKIECLVGIFADPAHVIRYDDGQVRQEFSICFAAAITGGQARTSEESAQVAWVHPHRLNDGTSIHPSIRRRIQTALDTEAKLYFT